MATFADVVAAMGKLDVKGRAVEWRAGAVSLGKGCAGGADSAPRCVMIRQGM
jgi:hypothetical protein